MRIISPYLSLLKILLPFFFILLCHPVMAQDGIAINELMASNRTTVADEDGDFEDWIELYNYSDSGINLKGWGLSDNYQAPFKWIFPEIIIQPQEYLMVWASGKNRTALPTLQQTIISEKSDWKYLDDGSDQGIAWRQPGFDDSSWQSGPAMLGYDTNNNTVFGTQLSFGGNSSFKHITYYFRNQFEISDITKYEDLELKLMIDDGAIVYLNGNEVSRVNLPPGTVNYTTTASEVITTLDISYHLISSSFLVNGTNTIAVEVHQYSRSSSDLRFDMEFFSKGRNLHTNFSISSDGEEIILTHPTNGLVDSLPPYILPTGVSVGRWPNGTGEIAFYSTPTPGEPNPEERAFELLPAPVFSEAAGFYTDPFALSLTSSIDGVTIIYTLDGSEPDPANLEGRSFQYKNAYPGGSLLSATYQSLLYTEPIYIQDRTPFPESLATFASDYNGSRYTSTTNRLFKGTVVRAISVKEGAIASPEITHTYFINPNLHNRYTFPVLSITTQASHLFDYTQGIYTPGRVWDEQANGTKNGGAPANYNRRELDWERPAYLEFFDGEATNPVISQNIGIRTHGGWSRAFPMKTLRIYSGNSYGEEYLNHQIFPDLPYQRYKRFILRNSGNDFGRTHFLDAAAQAVVSGMRMDTQAYRPVVLFINGEYWGIHNARERYDKYYLNRVYGVDPDNLDFLEINSGQPNEGDWLHYNNMTNYLSNNNIALDVHYQHVQTLMDVENFMDYQIAQIYIANTDWPGNNNNFWRLRTESYQPYAPYGHDGRWRWLLFDTDFGFGLVNNFSHNTLVFATNPSGPGWPNPPYSTLILRRLLLNSSFRNDFINRFADVLNTHFLPARANDIINQMRENLEPEMQEQITRWGRPGSMAGWRSDASTMNVFVNNRRTQVRQHIQNYFSISSQVNLSVDVSDPLHGYVRVNTIEISPATPGVPEQPYPWTGVYFYNVPVELEAIPKPGYIFSHWEGVDDVSKPVVSKTFSTASASVKAHFMQSEIIHNWNFNNLPADILENVYSDLSHAEMGVITYPGAGEGYMDRVNNGTSLNTSDGTPAGYALRVRNPSQTRELLIVAPTTGFKNISFSYATMRTNNGAIIQEVQYRTAEGGTWYVLKDDLRVTEDWIVHRFNFSNEDVSNNPWFAVRILFRGDQATGDSGNNRFDNIRVEGMDVATPIISDGRADDTNSGQSELKIWYHDGNIRFDNPYHGKSDLTIYNTSGTSIGQYSVYGKGHHSVLFNSKSGLYIGSLLGKEGVSTGRFMIIE